MTSEIISKKGTVSEIVFPKKLLRNFISEINLVHFRNINLTNKFRNTLRIYFRKKQTKSETIRKKSWLIPYSNEK